jgi:hypothetical protein
VFDVPAVDPDASERWSRALGDYTARVETLTRPAEGQPTICERSCHRVQSEAP